MQLVAGPALRAPKPLTIFPFSDTDLAISGDPWLISISSWGEALGWSLWTFRQRPSFWTSVTFADILALATQAAVFSSLETSAPTCVLCKPYLPPHEMRGLWQECLICTGWISLELVATLPLLTLYLSCVPASSSITCALCLLSLLCPCLIFIPSTLVLLLGQPQFQIFFCLIQLYFLFNWY